MGLGPLALTCGIKVLQMVHGTDFIDSSAGVTERAGVVFVGFLLLGLPVEAPFPGALLGVLISRVVHTEQNWRTETMRSVIELFAFISVGWFTFLHTTPHQTDDSFTQQLHRPLTRLDPAPPLLLLAARCSLLAACCSLLAACVHRDRYGVT